MYNGALSLLRIVICDGAHFAGRFVEPHTGIVASNGSYDAVSQLRGSQSRSYAYHDEYPGLEAPSDIRGYPGPEAS